MSENDRLAQARAKAAELRELEAEKADLEERLTNLNKRQYKISREELPTLMADAGITTLTLAAQGNHPAVEFKLAPYYEASIAASWDPDRRAAAFEYLESEGAGDLIKTEITIAMPREKRAEAVKLLEQLRAMGQEPSVKDNVHASTLKSWLKEKCEAGEYVDLDAIGASVGSVVKPKQTRKSTKKETI